MAKKRITKSDIAPKGVFDNVTQGAREAKTQIDLLTQAINILKEQAKQIKKAMPKDSTMSTKGMKDFDAQAKKANQTAQAKLGIDKKILHQKAKIQQLNAQQNKAIKTTIQATTRLNNEQRKGLGTLQKLEIHNTKLRATRAKLNLETKRGTRILGQINAKLDANNAKIRASGDAMKKQRLNVGNYGGAVGKLTGMLGKLGLGFGVFTALRGAFNTVKNFEQSQANLASVLGVNTEAMKGLTDQALKLGATTTFTASQVAELQIEFAKLGFTQTEIEGMTESTLLLAEATGTDLGEAATVVGATMRGFGLEVGDTQRVVDVMANSFSKSSLDMTKFSTAMSSVAPVAKLAGLGVEQTTALLGTLTDRGIEASTAGTGLRNMFLQSNKAGLTFNEAIEQIANSSDQTGESMKLFGTRGATLGVILANNQDQVEKLTVQLYASDGAARQMAETQRDTLGGSIKLLTSAWEGWILKQNEAGGASDKLRGIINFLADNLDSILDTLILLTKGFLAYKTIVAITTIQNRIMSLSFVKLGKAQGGVKGAFKGMTAGIKNVGKALKANAIGIAITAIIYAYTKLSAAYKVTNRASIKYAEIQEEISGIHSQAKEDIATEGAELHLLVAEIKLHNAGSKKRGELLQTMNEKYGTHLQNIKDETLANNQLDEAQQKVINNMVAQIRLQAKKDEFTVIVQELQKAEEIVNDALEERTKRVGAMTDAQVNDWKKLALRGQSSSSTFSKFLNKMSMQELRNHFITQNLSIAQKKDIELVNKLKQDQLDLEKKLMVTLKEKDATQEEVTAETPAQKAERERLEKLAGGGDPPKPKPYIDLIRATEDARLKILKEGRKKDELLRQKTFDRLIEDTEKKKTHLKDFKAWKIAQEDLLVKDLQKINDKYNKEEEKTRQKSRIDLMENAIKEKEIELDKVADIYENFEETETLRKEIDKDNIELIEEKAKFDVKATGLSTGQKDKIILDSEAKILKIKLDALKRIEEKEEESRNRLKQKFSDAEAEKYLELLKSSDSQEEIAKKMLEFQIKQLEELIAEYKKLYPKLTKEITAMETDLEQKKRARNKKDLDDEIDGAQEMQDLRQQAIQSMTDFFVKNADKRIAKLDEEIDAHKMMADELRELARDGNINAEQSLAEENRLIAEAEQEKAEQEKRKQRVLMVSAFIKAYMSALDSDKTPGEALTIALTSGAVLEGVIANIGSFFDGTEDTGKVGKPIDSKGGRLAVLHNNERVMTAKQNSRIGNVSNEEVARVMENERFGNIIEGNNTIGGFENILLLDQLNLVGQKLDKVNKTIENKPETNIQLGAITSRTMEIIESRKKGGLKTINTFKVKPQ